jgi:hypothetical protein
VAEECNCGDVVSGTREVHGRSKKPSLISRMNDQSLIQLKQIFLDCDDSSSRFRFAVLLSTKFPPVSYKFVLSDKLHGRSDQEYIFDVCIFSRSTEELVAVGMQNNDASRSATDAKSLNNFLSIMNDVFAAYPSVRSAYYSSSYGYDCSPSNLATKRQLGASTDNTEINFLEFRDGVYREIRG